MRETDSLVVEIKYSENERNDFIKKHKSFILSTIYKKEKRFITDSDDEYSIGLIAFSEAIDKYNFDKGAFIPFAEKIIKLRLIDYYRSQKKYNNEMDVDPYVFGSENREDDERWGMEGMRSDINKKTAVTEDNSIKYEIQAANGVFQNFGFSFFELAECSPKAEKTKCACFEVIRYILDNTSIIHELYKGKRLPVKTLEKNLEISRKIIERHRKYIIAAIEILSGEYPMLAEYLQVVRKEQE